MPAGMWSNPRCEHRDKGKRPCKALEARPQFTKPLKEVTASTKKSNRQPHYYCVKHQDLHPDVSALTGETREREDAA